MPWDGRVFSVLSLAALLVVPSIGWTLPCSAAMPCPKHFDESPLIRTVAYSEVASGQLIPSYTYREKIVEHVQRDGIVEFRAGPWLYTLWLVKNHPIVAKWRFDEPELAALIVRFSGMPHTWTYLEQELPIRAAWLRDELLMFFIMATPSGTFLKPPATGE